MRAILCQNLTFKHSVPRFGYNLPCLMDFKVLNCQTFQSLLNLYHQLVDWFGKVIFDGV